MKAALFVLAAILVAGADEPLPAPALTTSCSTNRVYCLVSKPGEDAVLYKKTGKRRQAMWKVPGWQRAAFVTNDGRYVATEYPGLNLLAGGYTPATVLAELWAEGRSCWRFTVADARRQGFKFERTVSHEFWGDVEGFDKQGKLVIRRVDESTFLVDPAAACAAQR